LILGDTRADAAFNKFARSVDNANKSVDRSNSAMKRQAAASGAASGGILRLTGEITGFGAAATAASRGSGAFARVLAGLNLATGVLEPAMAGLVVATGALAAAGTAAAAGMGAYGLALKPVMTQVSDLMKLQAQAAAGSKASQKQLHQMLKTTPPIIVKFAASVTRARDAYESWGNSLAKPVLAPLSAGLRLVRPALAAISPLVRAAAGALATLAAGLSARIRAGGLTSIVNTLLPHVRPVILSLGHAIGNVAGGIWGIIKAFLPMAQAITGGVAKLTARFRDWAASLPSHTGFQSLMDTFRQSTPLAMRVLKNLAIVLKNLASTMTGLASPANSRALLQMLIPLSGLLATLSKNQALVRFLFYMLAIRSATRQVAPAFTAVHDSVKFLGSAWQMVAKFAAATVAAEGAAEGMTVAQTIAAAATRAWGLAMDALPWVALAAAVIAVAVLIIKYHKQIWAFVQKVWHGVLAVIQDVWTWVKRNWPLLLSILTGPIGAAVIYIIRHWSSLLSGIKSAWNAVIGWFAAIPGRILHAAGNLGRTLYNKGRSVIQGLWDGMLSLFKSVASWFGSLPGKFLHLLGIASPPPWAIQAGRHIMGGLLGGMRQKWGPASKFISGLGPAIASTSAQMTGKAMAAAYGWTGRQWKALFSLWMGESGWRANAYNPASGATGIPQALPGSKMASAGADWRTNAVTQIRWGLRYIKAVYGTPLRAYQMWLARSPHWYQRGSWNVPVTGPAVVHRGEMIFPADVADAIRRGGLRSGPLVQINGLVVREEADVTLIGQKTAFAVACAGL
jgi:phage-related protein